MNMEMQRLTPVLAVEAIEPCLSFWTDRLGFEKLAEVPHEDRLGFVILRRGEVQVMYQTAASLKADMQLEASDLESSVLLYLHVDDLDAVATAMKDVPKVVERRKTFYGADEFGVREPGGNIVVFSHHATG